MTKIFFFVLLVTESIDNEISKSCNTLTFIEKLVRMEISLQNIVYKVPN